MDMIDDLIDGLDDIRCIERITGPLGNTVVNIISLKDAFEKKGDKLKKYLNQEVSREKGLPIEGEEVINFVRDYENPRVFSFDVIVEGKTFHYDYH